MMDSDEIVLEESAPESSIIKLEEGKQYPDFDSEPRPVHVNHRGLSSVWLLAALSAGIALGIILGRNK